MAGNTFLTPSIIARQALMVLENNLVMGGRVYRDFDGQFGGVGDTITVRKPASFTANEYNGSTITKQDVTETSTSVKLDKIPDVSFAVTSKQMALDIQDFSEQLIQPAVAAIAQYIDAMLCGLYVDVPYYVKVGSTPAISDLAGIGKLMNINKAPMIGRDLVVDPTTHAKYVVLDPILHAEKSGSTDALRAASMGRVLGLESFMDQNIKSHTAGTGTTAGKVAIDLTAGYKAGDKAIHVDGVATALKVGDLVTIGGNMHVVTVAGELSTADQDITIYPALKADAANDAEVTLVGDGTQSLAFHKNAFALVTRPLAPAQGGAASDSVSYNGLSIRVTKDYSMDLKSDIISLDMLCGFKTLTPELAVRFVG